jgi:O-antigen ligase
MPAMTTATLAAGARTRERLDIVGYAGLLGFVIALQVSIAAAGILLAFTLLCWAVFVTLHPERLSVPRMFWPLLVYAALTLVSSAFSPDPHASFVDSKQLVLFLLVPMVYEYARGPRSMTVMTVIITVGAVSAAAGIVQYGLLNYDHLGQRPMGALGHYMTYSGLLLLVTCAATWVGTTAAVALLLAMKDLRLIAVAPLAAALLLVVAPAHVANRFYSMFDLHDPTSRDRVAMLREGSAMIREHPLTGVGPNMVERVYELYRDPAAVEKINPHLHNVPVQIAAERGLPALGVWIWFVVVATHSLATLHRRSRFPSLTATGLAAIVGMLAAGLFEYNFGDSEFLMLFLVLVTLPLAAERSEHA